jgi:4-cresol dehydrogenase (hydroxylating)
MRGIPTSKTMASVYWRKRCPVPADADPNRDQCGLLWCAPIAPLDGVHADRVAKLASEILLEHGFEPMLSLTLVEPRSIACVVSIGYDREVPGEDQRAMACHQRLLESMLSAGYPPYRLGVQSMRFVERPPGLERLLAAIHGVTDPNTVLAPGRYSLDRHLTPSNSAV